MQTEFAVCCHCPHGFSYSGSGYVIIITLTPGAAVEGWGLGDCEFKPSISSTLYACKIKILMTIY